MLALEVMIDKVGLSNVLQAMAHICTAKAEHLRTSWQDVSSSQWWDKRANALEQLSHKSFMRDA